MRNTWIAPVSKLSTKYHDNEVSLSPTFRNHLLQTVQKWQNGNRDLNVINVPLKTFCGMYRLMEKGLLLCRGLVTHTGNCSTLLVYTFLL